VYVTPEEQGLRDHEFRLLVLLDDLHGRLHACEFGSGRDPNGKRAAELLAEIESVERELTASLRRARTAHPSE
jgi:hypothetical protein